ncbi:MAG: preprotein translocase subunit YajC [Muribaculaceae bacterium]|nr:preprotein translocase subunit YajC [Muribaculaceae bacterium]
MELQTILLQQQSEGGGWSGMLMIVAMIIIFYFFMIRPQSKKQKEIKKAREAMQKGSKIVTAGGIFGTIKSINTENNTIMMEVAPGVTIKVSREQVFPAEAEAPKDKKVEKEEK